jgi:D-amino peptidase
LEAAGKGFASRALYAGILCVVPFLPMRVYLMTDMEGVCGVLDHPDWALPSSANYMQGRRLLTMEVNAAIDGFYSAGASSVLVVDGHEAGGIDQELLDRRTLLLRGFPGPYPFGLDKGFDAMAWVGQHAKSGADRAHLPHTRSFQVLDVTVNGTSVGELGMLAMCGAFLGVPAIFASGDEALCREAKALLPQIETASVKRGLAHGSGEDLAAEAYRAAADAALHLHPEKAREVIRIGAATALARLRENRSAFTPIALEAPFVKETRYRAEGGEPAYRTRAEHATDLIAALNAAEARVGDRKKSAIKKTTASRRKK